MDSVPQVHILNKAVGISNSGITNGKTIYRTIYFQPWINSRAG